jgi:hypothetical protein
MPIMPILNSGKAIYDELKALARILARREAVYWGAHHMLNHGNENTLAKRESASRVSPRFGESLTAALLRRQENRRSHNRPLSNYSLGEGKGPVTHAIGSMAYRVDFPDRHFFDPIDSYFDDLPWADQPPLPHLND